MKRNVFIQSVLRQPVRTLLLALLVGVAAFAFVARATEFIVVRGEIDRIEATYRSVGVLSPLQFYDFTHDHDVTRAMALLENHRLVRTTDARVFTQGVMDGVLNTAAQSFALHSFFHPPAHGVDIYGLDHYFFGTIRRAPRISGNMMTVNILVDQLVQGDPMALREGDRVIYGLHGSRTVLPGWRDFALHLTPTEMALRNAGLWCPLGYAAAGDRLLFRASPMEGGGWVLRALVGEDGNYFTMVRSGGWTWPGFVINTDLRGPHDEVIYSVRAEDTDEVARVLAYNYERLAQHAENLSSVTVIGTRDMTAMPRFMDPLRAQLLDTSLFPGGRWLNKEDYLYARPVVVIPRQLAVRRQIRVGDTLTITLRDNPRPPWIDAQPNPVSEEHHRGIENWWDNYPAGWWGMTYSGHADWRDFPTRELELEVVGIYWLPPAEPTNNFTSVEMYIPASLIPDGFGWEDIPQLTGMYSFVLTSPRDEARFVTDTRSALAALGFEAVFVPTRFDALAQMTDPIRTSLNVNLAIFTAVSVMILALVVFLYIRQWRQSVAITKALGLPSSHVLRQLLVPVCLIWLPAVALGAAPGWWYALGEAEAVLHDLFAYEYIAGALIATHWLGIMAGGMMLLMLAGVLGAGANLVRHPVLEQLQGGTQKRRNTERTEAGDLPEGFAMRALAWSSEPLKKSRAGVWRSSLRHGLRHIFRSPVKTALAAGLALLFVFSLGWLDDTIHFTEAEIARLWRETPIEAQIVAVPLDEDLAFDHPALIAPASWDTLLASGFVSDAYLEAISGELTGAGQRLMGISHIEGFLAQNTRTIFDEQMGFFCEDMVLQFAPGFGPEDFVFVRGEPTPVLISRQTMEWRAIARAGSSEIYRFVLGEVLELSRRRWVHDPVVMYMHTTDWAPYNVRVVGVFDGGLQRAYGRVEGALVMPMEALYYHAGDDWLFFNGGLTTFQTGRPTYKTAHFVVDAARNRELDALRDIADAALAQNFLGRLLDVVPMELIINDEVITHVIIPMERNLSLLRVLYPIAIGAAFVLSLGLSLLTMLQGAKNAAILRVLGKTKSAAQVALITEQLIVCAVGVAAALLFMPIFNVVLGWSALSFAGLYLAGVLMGSFVGAVVISAKTPLELLQVRE